MKNLLKYLKPYKAGIIAAILLVFMQTLTNLLLPNLMSKIINEGILKNNNQYILKTGGIMLLITAGGVLCIIFANFLSARIGMAYGRDLRNVVFTRVEKYSLNEFDEFGTSSLITRTTNDITQLQMVVVMFLRIMAMAPLMCIGGIIMALLTNKRMSIVFIVIIPILVLIVVTIGKKVLPLFKLIQKKIDKINLVLRENLTGIRVIRAFNKTEYEKNRFNNANIDLTNTAIKVNRIMAVLMPLMSIILNITSVVIVWFSSKLIDNNFMQVGDMVAFIQYANFILISLLMSTFIFIMIPRAQASASRVSEVLNVVPEINDPKILENVQLSISLKDKLSQNVSKNNIFSRNIPPENKLGLVEFKNVTFNYKNAEHSALKNISFEAIPGETTAIIGSTGSGKSTLINLICRFYDVSNGSILIDGVDIRNMKQEDLINKIGLVSQKSILFSGTVSDNIRYGKQDASIEEIKHAADIAQATEFISNMKNGFDSQIAQGGTNISGGQKQRLSIARAFIKHPQIYLFDDSFSALDFKTDAKLRAALENETTNSTVIIVAQRVSTIMNANKIIVLDEGKIVGIGTHKELLKSCDIYHEIALSQMSEEELS